MIKKLATFGLGLITYVIVKPVSLIVKGLFYVSYSLGWLVYMIARILLAFSYLLMGHYRKSKDIIKYLWLK